MLTKEFAERFAREWIEAWNSHDLERVLKHYSPDVELKSLFVSRIVGEGRNTVRGLAELREYFGRAMEIYPELRFVPRHVFAGVKSLVVEYESVGGRLTAELLEFDDAGQVRRVLAHYSTEGVSV
jgi:hypothetical protein